MPPSRRQVRRRSAAAAKTIRFGPEIDVPDLRAFARDVRKLGAEYVDDLKRLNVDASEIVIDVAQATPGLAPHQQLAAADLRARRRANAAVIALGAAGRSKHFALGAEFGALRWPQFEPWRGNQWHSWEGGPGYFLHPAIRAAADQVHEMYGDGLMQLARRVFPD